MKRVIWDNLNKNEKKDILSRYNATKDDVEFKQRISDIINKVRNDGDKALKYYTKLFDKVETDEIIVDIENDYNLPENVKKSIEFAYKNIKNFHEKEIPNDIFLEDEGKKLWRKYVPIQNVGIYIPGGTAPLVSTSLMTLVPAIVAGCPNIVVCTPPGKDNKINPAILHVLKICGLKKVYKIGGAQAIAAMAFGTESVPKVSKIFGPGNQYVMEAKIQVSCDVNGASLDMPAGPSEVLVIADKTANPIFTASDLLAQAEHIGGRAILLTTDNDFANKVEIEIENQVANLKNSQFLKDNLEYLTILSVDSLDKCFDISNKYAPEHLILQIENAEKYVDIVLNAGSVFIGNYSSEALGDYVSGTNHVLPTSGYAKSYNGIIIESFMKSITFQKISKEGMLKMASAVEVLSDIEGLEAHKMSVVLRK
jgi:histidinol dehydrogenase